MHMAILVIENHSIKYQDDPPKRRGEGKSRGGKKEGNSDILVGTFHSRSEL